MRNLKVADLIRLVIAEPADVEDVVQKMFDWHYDRTMDIAKWVLGAAAALAASVILAYLKVETKAPWWQTAIVLFAALASSAYGIHLLWRLRTLNQQLIASLRLISIFRKMRPFLTQHF